MTKRPQIKLQTKYDTLRSAGSISRICEPYVFCSNQTAMIG